jgi:DNA-binding MurR/RpiR family transcriptional regulator
MGNAATFENTSALSRSLEEHVRELLPTLTPKRRRLATLLLDDPYRFAFSSAEEIGRDANVDGATVVRFSRTLGFEGFLDLKRAIQRDIPQFVTSLEKLRRTPSEGLGKDVLTVRAIEQDIENLGATLSLTNPEDLINAASVLSKSERIVILASGMSTPVGWLLMHLLRLIGKPATFPPVGVGSSVELAGLGPTDTAVAIGLWRYIASTVELLHVAKEHGAFVIAITDSKGSPLAEAASVSFVTPTYTPELSHSLVAPISVASALATAVYVEDPVATMSRLAAVDEVYRSTNVVVMSQEQQRARSRAQTNALKEGQL